MLFFILPYLLLYLLNVPLALLTAYIAYSHGQRFLPWLLLGLGLPFVSVFIAIGVAIRHKQRAAAARGGAPAPVPAPGEFE
jgi:hypothetical protein